jgi:hypothetical protein
MALISLRSECEARSLFALSAHRSDQGAPADHSECRERVPCTRREKPEMRLASRTRERMVLGQLVFYKILIESDL